MGPLLPTGVPPPSITWYKDAAVVEVPRLSRFRQRGDGGLQISGLLPDDTGMFQCFARNAAGEVQTSTYLAVTSKSGFSRPAPEPLPPRMQLDSKPGASEDTNRIPEDCPSGSTQAGTHQFRPLLPQPRVQCPRGGLRSPQCPVAQDRFTGSLREAALEPAQAFQPSRGPLLCRVDVAQAQPRGLAHVSKEENQHFNLSSPACKSLPPGSLFWGCIHCPAPLM